MRMFRIYGVTADGDEEHIHTIANAAQGKAAAAEARAAGYLLLRCRDCLGGLRFEYNLETGRKTA